MKNPKTKISLFILVMGIFTIAGWFIWWRKGRDITAQPKDMSCQSELVKKQADSLSLSCAEFKILSTSLREYLFQKYPFLKETEFGIRYEKVPMAIEGSVVIDAYPSFITPPPVIRVSLLNGRVFLISFIEPTKEHDG